MAKELLEKLEDRIDNAIETIELLKLQIEELDSKNQKLQDKNQAMASKQTAWEQNLNTMLEKLDTIETETAKKEYYQEELEAETV